MKRYNTYFILLIIFGFGCTVVDTDLFESILEIRNQNRELLSEVKALQTQSDSLINELKSSAATQQELMEQVSQLQLTLVEILTDMSRLSEQLNTQGADVEAIRAQMAALQEQYQEIISQLQQLQELSKILAEIEFLKGQLSHLAANQQDLTGVVWQNQQDLQTVKGLLEFILSQTLITQERLSALTLQLGEQGADIKILLEQYQKIEKQLEKLVKLGQILEEIQGLKFQLSELDRKYELIVIGLGQNQEAINALKTQVNSLNAEMDKNFKQVMDLLNTLMSMGSDGSSWEILMRLEELIAKCEAIKNKLDQLLYSGVSIPSNGLIAWWPFNGNTNDASGNNYNGIGLNIINVEGRSGLKETAYYFNGNSRITIKPSVNDDLDLISDFTIFSRFKSMDYQNNQLIKMILSKHLHLSNQDGGYIFGIWSQNLKFPQSGKVGFQASPYYNSTTYPDNKGIVEVDKWYDFVTTYKKDTGEFSYYLNAKLIFKKVLFFNIFKNDRDIVIGSELSNSGFIHNFIGVIDDVAIWNRVLTEQEISRIYIDQGL